MKIICVSDTHNYMNAIRVPSGDVLIHAGDATMKGGLPELAKFNNDIGALPHKHKIFVPGNHDWLCQRQPAMARAVLSNCTVLIDETVEIDGIKFWGSPWQPEFCNWAFNLQIGPELKAKWDLIPDDTDVLITHGPPEKIRDLVVRTKENVGCPDLREAVLGRVKPQYHVFGHIHDGYGLKKIGNTLFINASMLDEDYRPRGSPIMIEI